MIAITKKESFFNKVLVLFVLLALFSSITLYLLNNFEFLKKINSVNELRGFVESFNGYAVLIYILVQFFQVTILPVPSIFITSVGVLLFGPLKSAIFGAIGVISGSIVSYYFGRIFGVKVVGWLVGYKKLEKAVKFFKGKDKALFTFMFLFPFFPDDLLCMLAGTSAIKPKFFIIMTICTRSITTFLSAFTLNNNLIPYDSWWGISIYVLFFIFTIYLAINIIKNDKFFLNKLFNVKNAKNIIKTNDLH
ncbi:MAG: TVP38/TMEM64 family protein [Clostridia bacterium]|nr:TVP38/TMEM64 family protein [Clostridia bacterium]